MRWQADLGTLFAHELKMDTTRADEQKISATTDRLIDVLQRRVPTIQRVEKTVDVPRGQYNNKVINVPVVIQRPVTTEQTMQKAGRLHRLSCVAIKHLPSRQRHRKFLRFSFLTELLLIAQCPCRLR